MSRLLEQALDCHQRGQLGEAERLYRQILNTRPDDVDALHFLGILCAQQGCIDEALANLDKAIALKPDYADAFYNRGNVLAALLRYDEALASYDRALAIRPAYAEALENRGNVLSELHRYDEALASYDRALTLLPDYVQAHDNRGNVLLKFRRFEEASCRSAGVRPTRAEDGRPPRALSPCRSVPGYPALQCPRHRRRRALGGLANGDVLRRHLEAAYTTMCDIRQRGERPKPFRVPALNEASRA